MNNGPGRGRLSFGGRVWLTNRLGGWRECAPELLCVCVAEFVAGAQAERALPFNLLLSLPLYPISFNTSASECFQLKSEQSIGKLGTRFGRARAKELVLGRNFH